MGKLESILSGTNDTPGFWPGNPLCATKLAYARGLSLPVSRALAEAAPASDHFVDRGDEEIELNLALGSDLIWVAPEIVHGSWKSPDGRPLWDVTGGKPRESLGSPGVFAETEDPSEVDDFPWPDPACLDLSVTREIMEKARARNLGILGGTWGCFFHIACDFFGMENYFVKMYTDPEVVHRVTEHILDFYLALQKRILDEMGGLIDACFFGNDLGTQRSPLIGPELFRTFFLPYARRFVGLSKSYGKRVFIHSCGSIVDFIPDLIEIGVDGLHPLQALAAGMDADNLVARFGGKLVFMGGMDTQDLLPFGKPEEVEREAERLLSVFGNRFILSPSHEALLPNVPIANILALRSVLDRRNR
jgi:uroporphyrinogen decarboxylase